MSESQIDRLSKKIDRLQKQIDDERRRARPINEQVFNGGDHQKDGKIFPKLPPKQSLPHCHRDLPISWAEKKS